MANGMMELVWVVSSYDINIGLLAVFDEEIDAIDFANSKGNCFVMHRTSFEITYSTKVSIV